MGSRGQTGQRGGRHGGRPALLVSATMLVLATMPATMPALATMPAAMWVTWTWAMGEKLT